MRSVHSRRRVQRFLLKSTEVKLHKIKHQTVLSDRDELLDLLRHNNIKILQHFSNKKTAK